MGLLENGHWKDIGYETEKHGGAFKRWESAFRHEIKPDGPFKPETNRYHLYVSHACPWANRAMIFRNIKGLENHISVSVVHPHMLENGWTFEKNFPGATGDTLYNKDYLHEIYTMAEPAYSGRVTVPVLWDKQTKTIVSNESSDIIRMFNTDFNNLTGNTQDFYPAELRTEIDSVNNRIYSTVNNGVYKAGFATQQSPYEDAVNSLFGTLDIMENRIKEDGPYLLGKTLTEADWRFFTTLIRFDSVYYVHFKCNVKQISAYPTLHNYVKTLYEKVKDTIHFNHIKEHYYYSHEHINPHRIIPIGPNQNV